MVTVDSPVVVEPSLPTSVPWSPLIKEPTQQRVSGGPFFSSFLLASFFFRLFLQCVGETAAIHSAVGGATRSGTVVTAPVSLLPFFFYCFAL